MHVSACLVLVVPDGGDDGDQLLVEDLPLLPDLKIHRKKNHGKKIFRTNIAKVKISKVNFL